MPHDPELWCGNMTSNHAKPRLPVESQSVTLPGNGLAPECCSHTVKAGCDGEVVLLELWGGKAMERVMGIEPTSKAWEAFFL